jgi:hypothetical protein
MPTETKKNSAVENAQSAKSVKAGTPAKKKMREQARDVAGGFLDFIREQGVVDWRWGLCWVDRWRRWWIRW